jgi:putative CocE/NonD family hydrolase
MLSWALAKLTRLRAAEVRAVSVERDVEAKMPDGTVLLADRWYPSTPSGGEGGPPVVLLRSPYGRRQLGIVGRLFAERGYQVVIQSCRGTFGSGGDFEPFRNERADGSATLDWLAAQPWSGGEVGLFGPSYLGAVQWAVGPGAADKVAAFAPGVTSSTPHRSVLYPGDAFALETDLGWAYQVSHQELGFRGRRAATRLGRRLLPVAFDLLPLSEADQHAVGHHVEFFQQWLAHERSDDEWWQAIDFSDGRADPPPVSLVGGWYDLFLLGQVRDFEALQAGGSTARITIGPWHHTSPGVLAEMVRDALEWFDAHLLGRAIRRRAPVRLFVMGSKRWVEAPTWPPPAELQRWHLHAGGRLDPGPPAPSEPDRYRYDPRDPTPSAGGASNDRRSAGPKHQAVREERPDVLTFSSAPLTEDVTVIGPLEVELHARASSEARDYVVRLCDVDRKGRSTNISDGIVRLRAGSAEPRPDGTACIRISMWPTACTFRRGHRIRLQVSSGAHPFIARNTGSGEPLATARTLVAVEHEVFHDPERPSHVVLPISAL